MTVRQLIRLLELIVDKEQKVVFDTPFLESEYPIVQVVTDHRRGVVILEG